MSDARSLMRAFLQPVLIAVIAGLLLRGAVQTYSIPSGSMSPTLQAGDHILVTPYGRFFQAHSPQRGDVVVFRSPFHPDESYVKRVIALPGDEIELRDHEVRVNGRRLQEPWIRTSVANGIRQPEILPDGYYFVMGDARDNSVDSRTFGPVSREHVFGRARLIFWSSGGELAETANASVFASRASRQSGVRWNRILTPVR